MKKEGHQDDPISIIMCITVPKDSAVTMEIESPTFGSMHLSVQN